MKNVYFKTLVYFIMFCSMNIVFNGSIAGALRSHNVSWFTILMCAAIVNSTIFTMYFLDRENFK